MSYQIKRTPYFRRMFNNSRRNGQLQRLREEYERIQEFNDRTIELKMRQVRLKRLFREIEDINESPTTSNIQRRQPTLVPLTPDAMRAQQRRERLETLERARELGQEISRRNAQLAESGAGFYLRSELRLTAKMRAADDARREAQERRQRAARRISYGNAQSRSNIERIVQRRNRRLVAGDSPSTGNAQQVLQFADASSNHNQLNVGGMKRAMLQQRLEYGNSRSTNNMMRSQLAAAHRVINCITTTENLAEDSMQMYHHHQLQLQMMHQQHIQEMRERERQEQLEQEQLEQEQLQREQLEQDRLEHIEYQQRQLQQMQLQLQQQEEQLKDPSDSPSSASVTASKHNCNIEAVTNSELEMHTAQPPPSEPEALRFMSLDDDDVPTTSQNALRVADVTSVAATIAAMNPLLAVPQPLHESKSDHDVQRWHRISLTLPWVKIMDDTLPSTGGQLAGAGMAMGYDNFVDSSAATATENFESIGGPSLLQEDLMQIMDLDDGGQVPTMHLRHSSCNQ